LIDQPHPIDRHVGDRLKFLRVKAGLSQQAIAQKVGVTFQQVQKYEKGSNRVSASRLYEFTRVLGCEVQDFFSGIPDTGKSRTSLKNPSRLDYEILTLVDKLPDDHIRRQIRGLLTAITELPDDPLNDRLT